MDTGQSHGQSRVRITPGDPWGRASAVIWAKDGGLTPWLIDNVTPGTFTLIGPNGERVAVPREQPDATNSIDNWFTQFCGKVTFPPDCKPGIWKLDASRGPEFTFEVGPPYKAREFVTVEANRDSLNAYNKAVAEGKWITLAPGLHEWAGAVGVPDWPLVIRGPGATIKRLDNGDYANRIFYLGTDLTLDGVTVEGTPSGAPWFQCLLFHAGPGAAGPANPQPPTSGTGFVCRRCTFRDLNLGGYSEIFVDRCVFQDAGCTIAQTGLYHGNHFHGEGQPHSWDSWVSVGATAFIENTFHQTPRGPLFLTHWGPNTDNLFLRTRLENVGNIHNGEESFLTEGPGEFSRNIIAYTLSTGPGAVCVFDTDARDNFIFGQRLLGPGGTHAWPHDVTGNVFTACRWHGGHVGLYGGTGNTFRQCRWTAAGPGEDNQFGYGMGIPRDPAALTAVYAARPGNVIEGGNFFLSKETTAASSTVTLKDVWVNGAAVADVVPVSDPPKAAAPVKKRKGRSPSDYGMPTTFAEYKKQAEK